MRGDIDFDLLYGIGGAGSVCSVLERFLHLESAAADDTPFNDLEELWMDNIPDIVVNTETIDNAYLTPSQYGTLRQGAEDMNSANRFAAEKWEYLYENGASDIHNRTLATVAYREWPDHADRQASLDFLLRVQEIVENVEVIRSFGDTSFDLSVALYGSSISQLCTSTSDIDLVLTGMLCQNPYGYDYEEEWDDISSLPRDMSIQVLKSLHGHFARAGGYYIEGIYSASIPLLKIYDTRTGKNCDLCFPWPRMFHGKEHLLLALNMLDERFRMLYTLAKLWAEEHNLIGASIGRLNKYTLAQLVIFHLQTRPDPILPPLRIVMPGETMGRFQSGCRFPGGCEMKNLRYAAFKLRRNAYHHQLYFEHDDACFGGPGVEYRNSETIGDLFNSFMVLLSGIFHGVNTNNAYYMEDMNEYMPLTQVTRQLRLSTYYGCLYFGENPSSIFERGLLFQNHPNDSGVFFVEDPVDKENNTARALSRSCSRAIAQAANFALKSFHEYHTYEYVSRVFGIQFAY